MTFTWPSIVVNRISALFIAGMYSALSLPVLAQGVTVHGTGPAIIIIPQAHLSAMRPARSAAMPAAAVETTGVNVGVDILGQVATTTLDIQLRNPVASRLEAQLVVPVPEGAVLRGFTFRGASPEARVEVLPREEARRLYESIVARTRDPALVEFLGYASIRTSVFPLEPRGTQTVRLVYEHLLAIDGDRVDYVLPRTESVDYRVPWTISVEVRSTSPLGTLYSPSHGLEVTRLSEKSARARLRRSSETEPGPFRLSYLLQRDEVAASLLAYPDPQAGGGYFLMLASVPTRTPGAAGAAPPLIAQQRREVILVLDRSGSMAGGKLEQVRAAALQVLEGLDDGEAFNIVVYHEAVETFAPEPVIKTAESMRAARAYLRSLRVRGGTNIHDALVETLQMRTTPGCLPIVLFLTDGLPTIGQTSEKVIRELATRCNPQARRIFTFGVGVDVNAPLLDRLAQDSRATATLVLPEENVEVKVGQVFCRLSGPVLAVPSLRVCEPGGDPAPGRVTDLTPARLPDLFDGDQLVVLGRYVGNEPLNFVLSGEASGRRRTFRFRFPLDKATTRNAFVPRLWASRQIGALTDAIRDLGADSDRPGATALESDPRLAELTGEIIRLSKEFGILTEYTAFFAREGTDLSKPADLLIETRKNYDHRALKTRWGYGAANQLFNSTEQRSQSQLKLRNDFLDDKLNRVEISTVQQMNDRAFFKRGNRWVDSALVDRTEAAPRRVVEIGSDEFRRLADRLAAEGRPGTIALQGEILLHVDGETVLIR